MNTASNTLPCPVRPVVREGEHPIESTRYLLETPAISALFLQVIQWINNRIPGAMFFGWPRRGKTKALLLLIAEIARRFPGMPVVFLEEFARNLPNENEFMELLLKEAGHAVVERGDVGKKLERLVEFLALRADESGQHRVMLIFDEAQILQERHYVWLISVHNQLDRRGINLIVLLVGQHQLLKIRTRYIADEKHQIVGRFMVHVREFHGVRSADELKTCLHSYDEESQYPVGSGWSFTRFYLTDWFADGGRLSSLAQDFWSVICEVRKRGKLQADTDMPMQDCARTVEHFLRIAASVDEKTQRRRYDLALTNDVRAAFHEALQASGYVSALKLDWKGRKK